MRRRSCCSGSTASACRTPAPFGTRTVRSCPGDRRPVRGRLRAPIVKEWTMSKFVVLAAMLACSALVVPSVVGAQETRSAAVAKPINLGLLVGFGTDLGEDFNPWGFGIGVRGGY